MVTSFLTEARAGMGKVVHRTSPAAMAALMDYHWPGNMRELKSTIECAIIHCTGDTLETEDLRRNFDVRLPRPIRPQPTCPETSADDWLPPSIRPMGTGQKPHASSG